MLQGLRRKIGRYAAPRAKEGASFSVEDKPEGLTPFEDAAWGFRKQNQDLRRLETELTQMLTQIKAMCAAMAAVAELFSETCSDDDRSPCVGEEYKKATKRVEREEAERLEQSIRFTVLDPLRDRLERHAQLQEQLRTRDKLAAECKTLRAFAERLPTLRLEDDDKRAQTYLRLDKVIGELAEEEKKLLPLLEEAVQSGATSSTAKLFNTMRLQTSIFFSHASQSIMESLLPSEKEAVAESSQALKVSASATQTSSSLSLSTTASKLSKLSSLTSDGWSDVDGSSSSTAPDGVEVLEGSEEDEEFNGSPITLEDFEAGRVSLVPCNAGKDDAEVILADSAKDTSELVALASHPVVPPNSPVDEELESASDEEWSKIDPPRRSTSPSPTSNRFVPITPRRTSSMFWSIRKSIRGKFNYSSGDARFIRQSSAPDTSTPADNYVSQKSEDQPGVIPQNRAEWEAIEACLWEIDARELKSSSKPFLAACPTSCADDIISRLLQKHASLCLECISYLRIEDLARLSKVNYCVHSYLVDCVPAWKKCIRSGGLSDVTRTSIWLSVFYESTPWRSNGIASHHLSAERRRNMYDQLLAKLGTKLTNGLLAEVSQTDEDTRMLDWLREIDVDVVRTCHRSIYTKSKNVGAASPIASSILDSNASVMVILNEMLDRVVQAESHNTSSDSSGSVCTPCVREDAMSSDLGGKIRRVLRAYVVYNPRVGYCQGMGFLVRLLAEVTEDEADIFWLFVGFSEPENDRNLYEPGMAVLQPLLSKFELLFSTHMPELYAHFEAEGVHVATFCTRWFLTFFSSSETLTQKLVIRLLDIFIVDGWRIIFSMSLVILDKLREQLMRCDLEGILRVLQFPRSYMADSDELHQGELVRHALAFSISRSINSI